MTIEQEIAGVVPASLDIEAEASKAYIPEDAKWSSAGLTSLLANDVAEVERSFGMMLSDFDNDSTFTAEKLKENAVSTSRSLDRNVMMEELANPEVSFERKKQIIQEFAKPAEWKNDTSTLVTEKYLVAPSGNETVDQEKRRMDLANRLAPIHEYRNEVASIRNALLKDKDNVSKFHAADSFLEFLMPFSENAQAFDTLSRVKETLGMPKEAVKNAMLPGSAKDAIRKAMEKVPPAQLKDMVKKVAEQLKQDSGMIIRNDNHTAVLTMFDQLFGEYTGFDKFTDNTVGLLDASVIFSPVISAGLKPIAKALEIDRLTKLATNVERRLIADAVSERSAAGIVRDANPDKAREFHKMVVTTEGDTIAKAAYGTSKQEAVASDVLPQVDSVDGSVVNKVPDIEKKTLEIDKDLADYVQTGVSYRYTDAELQSGVANIVHDFHNADGLHVNPSMGQIGERVEGDNVIIKGVYGNTEGGFSSAEAVFERAKVAFRKRGIKDEEITLLQNKGGRYEPVNIADVKGVDGDYLVQIEMKVPVAGDISKMEPLSVKYNIFDRIPSFQFARSGNVQRWFVDAGSMFSKYISGAASVSIDRAAELDRRILSYFQDFADNARSLKADRQDKLMEHLKEANHYQLELTDAQLVAKGFTGEEVEIVKKWRRANDNMFFLENNDLVKTLTHQKFKIFDNGNDRFIAKDIPNAGLKEQVYNKTTKQYDTLSVNVYDPTTQSLVRLTEQELDNLYQQGGTFARFRRPIDVGGQQVEYIRVENNASNYLRSLRDTDQVLNYRKGYFQVQYDSPLFVVQKVVDPSGKVFEKRIAVASSQKEADKALADYARRDGVSTQEWGFVAEDKRGMRQDGDAYWDLQSASGRIAQRHRGKRLEGLTGTNLLGMDMEHIVDPVEASIRAARSLSARVATRDVLETMKSRAMFQYQDFFPSNGMGGVRWPSNPTDIVSKTKSSTKDIADARTTWEYINYLENGYINTMDESWKWAMNAIANTMGNLKLTPLEKAAYALQDLGPSQLGKELVFHAYIGTNPIRQLLVQPHQAIRMLAYNPKGFYQSFGNAYGFINEILRPGSTVNKEQAAFNKALRESGLMSAVDKQNLVRGSLIQMTESSNKAKRVVGAALSVPRRMGFDLGERANILMHYANVWDKKKRAGLDVFDKRVQETIHSEARAASYDMNIAGDMPYNQNWAATLMQFAQVPHKALLQVSNRRMAVGDRIRMAIFDTAMWGVPVYAISDWVGKDLTPEDPEIRNLLQGGIEQFVLNNAISTVIGKDAQIDFKSSFSPYDWGWAEVARNILVDGSVGKALSESPSGKLLFGESSRLREAFTTMGQFLHMKDSYGTDPTAWRVVEDFLRISSGFRGMSDAYRAAYLREANAAMTKAGVLLDPERSNFEVLMGIAGFQNKSVADMYAMSEALFNNKKKFKDEVQSVYKEVMQTMFNSSQKPGNELADLAKVLGEMERVYNHDPEVSRFVMNQFEKDVQGKNKWLIQLMLKASGTEANNLPSLRNRVRDAVGISEEDKQAVEIILNDLEESAKYFEGVNNQ